MTGRPFLRRCNPVPVFCCDDPFWFQLDGDDGVSAIVDLFKDPVRGLTLRIKVADPAGTCPAGDFEVRAHHVRDFAQFLLRRLRQEATQPVAASENRLYPKVEDRDGKTFDKEGYRRASGR